MNVQRNKRMAFMTVEAFLIGFNMVSIPDRKQSNRGQVR